jgi:hypothetical protein
MKKISVCSINGISDVNNDDVDVSMFSIETIYHMIDEHQGVENWIVSESQYRAINERYGINKA